MANRLDTVLRRSHHSGSAATVSECFQAIRSDYSAAQQSRFRRVRPGLPSDGGPADYHYRNEFDYLKMLELFRDMERNDPIVSQGVRRLVDNVVQKGFTIDPNTGNDWANEILRKRTEYWAWTPDLCDVAREHDFCTLSKLSLRRTIVDGDILNIGTDGAALQQIEAHLLRTPRRDLKSGAGVVHGIELDGNRQRINAWVRKDEVDPLKSQLNRSDFRILPFRDAEGLRQIFHVYNPDRVTQSRGVSAFCPIVDIAGMHDDVQFAKLVQQQLVSCFAILRHRAPGSGVQQPAQGDVSVEQLSNGVSRLLKGVAPGMEIVAAEGETIDGFSPNVPNAEFFDHALLLLTFIAINLNLPVAVLLLDPSNTNFSGWRGAIDQARIGFQEIQRWLISRFFQPVYEWLVKHWLTDPEDKDLRVIAAMHRSGEINAFEHNWNPPTWSYIEPTKDAGADLLITTNSLNSRRRIFAQRGLIWRDVFKEIVDDHRQAIQYAVEQAREVNEQYNLQPPLHWRELLPIPMPQGVQIGMNFGDTAPAAKGDKNG